MARSSVRACKADPVAAAAPTRQELTEDQRTAVREELKQILESGPFRSSKRSRECLSFIVEAALEGHFDALKERCIGTEVFGRDPYYDTSLDAVVRISANELRKRLAQYQLTAPPDAAVRVTLPAGSYVPELQFRETPDIGEQEDASRSGPPATGFRRPLLAASAGILGLLAILGAMALWGSLRKPAPVLEQFWAPVLKSPRPVLINPGQAVVYLLSRRVHQQYDADNPPEVESGPHVARIGSALISGTDIVPVSDQYTCVGDAVALGRLMEMFGRYGKASQVRFGGETSFADLRDSPAVLLSAFTNRWNLDMARDLRFSFQWQNHSKMITDRTAPGRVWRTEMDQTGRTQLDYALICRIFNGTTGQPVVQAGGITQYGTQAAGEFLTNNEYWERLASRVPRDWLTRNLQLVIRTRIIGNTPAPPEIVAVHSW